MLDDDGKEVPGTKGYKYVLLNSYPLLLISVSDTLVEQRTYPAFVSFSRVERRKRRRKIKSLHSTRSF